MKLMTPTADLLKIDLLENSFRQMQNPSDFWSSFPADLVAEAQSVHAAFRQSYTAYNSAYKDWRTRSEAYKDLEALLRQRIRDAYQLIKRKARDPLFPKALFKGFGLQRDGTQSSQAQQLKAPIQTAYQIAAAEADAVASNFTVLIDPTPAELIQLADQLAAMKNDLSLARSTERDALAAIKLQRATADVVITKIKLSLRMATIGFDRKKQRDLLQSLGFNYRNGLSATTANDGGSGGQGRGDASVPDTVTDPVTDPVADPVADPAPDAGSSAGDGVNAAGFAPAQAAAASRLAPAGPRPPRPLDPATDPTFLTSGDPCPADGAAGLLSAAQSDKAGSTQVGGAAALSAALSPADAGAPQPAQVAAKSNAA